MKAVGSGESEGKGPWDLSDYLLTFFVYHVKEEKNTKKSRKIMYVLS